MSLRLALVPEASEINGRVYLTINGRVLAVDFGERPHGGVLAHFRRHGHLDIQKIMDLLGNAGLTVVNSGSMGMNNLQFVLAEAPPDLSVDLPSEA